MDNTRPIGESELWSTTCARYIKLKKHVIPKAPSNWSERMNTPLWAPHTMHKTPTLANYTQVFQKKLREVGIDTLGSILDSNSNLKS